MIPEKEADSPAPFRVVPAAPPPPAQPRSRRFLQVSLRTMLLVMVACAVWTAHVVNVKRVDELTLENQRLELFVRDLHVKEIDKGAFVREIPSWFDECRIHYYLPPGKYRLNLATREVQDDGSFPATVRSVDFPEGTHVLSIEASRKSDESWTLRALIDDKPILEHDEPKSWCTNSSSTGGPSIEQLAQHDVARPVILFRRRFMQKTSANGWMTPKEPCNGIMYWIEREP